MEPRDLKNKSNNRIDKTSDTSDIKVEEAEVTCPDKKYYPLIRLDDCDTMSNFSTSSSISDDDHLNSMSSGRVQIMQNKCDSKDGIQRICSLQELRSNTFQERMQSNLMPISPYISRTRLVRDSLVKNSPLLPVDAPVASVTKKKINRKMRVKNTKSNQASSVASKTLNVSGSNGERSNHKPLRSILKRKNANQERSAKVLRSDSIALNVSERGNLASTPILNEGSTSSEITDPNNAIQIVLTSPFLLTPTVTNSIGTPRSNPITSRKTQRVYDTFVKILPKGGASTIPVVSDNNVIVNTRRSGDQFRRENDPPVNSSIRIDAQVTDKSYIIIEESEEKVPVGVVDCLQSFPQHIESQALEQVIVLSDSDDDMGDVPVVSDNLHSTPSRNTTDDKQSDRTSYVTVECSDDGVLLRTDNDFTLEIDDIKATNTGSNLRCEKQSVSADEVSLFEEAVSSDEGAVVEDLSSRSKNGNGSKRKTGCDLLNFLNFTGLEELNIKTPVSLKGNVDRSKKDAGGDDAASKVDISDLVFTLRKTCVLCGKMCANGLPRHLLEEHFDKGEIRTFTESRKGSAIRRQILKDWYLLANYAGSVESHYNSSVRQICSICLANVARGGALLHYFQCTSKKIKVDRVPIELEDVLKDLDPLLLKVKKDLTRENFLELSKSLLVSIYILNGELSTVDFLLTTDYHRGREFNSEVNSRLKEMMDNVIKEKDMIEVSLVVPQRNCIGMPLFLTSKQLPAANFISKCRRKKTNSYLFTDLFCDFEKRLTIFEALQKYVKIDSLPRTILERFRNQEQLSLANCPPIYKHVPAKYEKLITREKSKIQEASGVQKAGLNANN